MVLRGETANYKMNILGFVIFLLGIFDNIDSWFKPWIFQQHRVHIVNLSTTIKHISQVLTSRNSSPKIQAYYSIWHETIHHFWFPQILSFINVRAQFADHRRSTSCKRIRAAQLVLGKIWKDNIQKLKLALDQAGNGNLRSLREPCRSII